jgi:hypothetical protein
VERRLLTLSLVLALAGLGLFLLYQYILDQQSITWRDYMKVRDGMTQVEVEALLGRPQSIDAMPDGGKEVRWIGRKQGMIYVEFSAGGALIRKQFTELARDGGVRFFSHPRD